ncbi:hypothetical protein ABID99_003519 [Mucilaginibacter sp. OAE612]|uniref:hypothetical protein n=1 Tax=Mucilaginibacter sp. OAE612 TaxID=3156444 RepID=UPI00359D867F
MIWNDRQAESRLAAMKAVYTDDIVFYESIIELIAKLQEQWPLEFRFELTRPVYPANHPWLQEWILRQQQMVRSDHCIFFPILLKTNLSRTPAPPQNWSWYSKRAWRGSKLADGVGCCSSKLSFV